jgi:hypothetical protein
MVCGGAGRSEAWRRGCCLQAAPGGQGEPGGALLQLACSIPASAARALSPSGCPARGHRVMPAITPRPVNRWRTAGSPCVVFARMSCDAPQMHVLRGSRVSPPQQHERAVRKAWSAVDGGHVRFVLALARGRRQLVQPVELVVAQLDAVGSGVLLDATRRVPGIGC